jgi:hypothetical protein
MTEGGNGRGWAGWLLGRGGLWAAGLWGFAEGTLFFVVPDVLFTLTTALRPRRGLLQLAAVVGGAALAGSVMYAWSAARPAEARAVVAGVPYVGPSMVEGMEQRMRLRGAWAMLEDPLGGVPYKVYSVLAPAFFSLPEFLLLSVPVRLERLLVSWIPFALFGLALARLPDERRRRVALVVHGAVWVSVYAYYWRWI